MAKLPTIRPERILEVRMAAPISAMAASHDGRSLAAADYEQRVIIWSVDDGRVLHKYRAEASTRIRGIRWSDDGKQLLLLVGSDALWLVNTITGFMHAAWKADEPVLDAMWSRDGTEIFGMLRSGIFFDFDPDTSKATTGHFGKIRYPKELLRFPTSDNIVVLSAESVSFAAPPSVRFVSSPIVANTIALSPDGSSFASVQQSNGAVIWVFTRGSQFMLEGHAADVETCAFSANGRLLVSIDRAGALFIWDLAGRVPVFNGRLAQYPSSQGGSRHLTFDSPLRLLQLDPQGERVLLYDLSSYVERPSRVITGYLRHTSAKVVIAGEARVGKTSLAHRLVEDRYVEHESTHGVKFWSLAPETLTPSAATPPGERREVVLWDLGGQEEYQLIHQLFLHDTTVALLLFDPARSGAALEEVEAWNKRLAKQLHGRPVRKLLVGTKQDAETPVDRQSIDSLVQRCGFEGFYATSAKSGRGLGELRDAMARAVDWETLSTVSRPEVFQQVRDAIDEHRKRGEVVLHYRDLESELERGLSVESASVDTIVRQLALQGVLAETRDAQGERTLILQVGEVDRYAGSLLLAARDNPSGVPALEKALLATRIPELPGLPAGSRLPFREERWVLECVLQLMLEHGLCVEHAGLYVFPTCFRVSDAMPLEAPTSTPIFYEFSGAIDNIYSSLVAAFAVSKRFGHMRLGKDRAEFEGAPGSVCGLRKVDQSAGVAHLDLYFGDQTTEDARSLFRDFVNEHLREHGVEMVERLNMKCSKCARPLDEHVLRERLAIGRSTVICQLCEHQNQIALPPSAPSDEREQRTRALRGEIAEGKRQAVDRARALIPHEVASPAQARPTRILHLSDLHVSEQDDVDSLVGPLLADLQDSREGIGPGGVDYLVVSGDLTNCASPGEMGRAYEVLVQLIERLGLSAQRCVVVPGNHDLSWDEAVYEFKMGRQVPGPRDDRLHVSQGNGVLVRNEARYPERFRSFSRHLFHPLFQREYPLDPQEQGLTAFFPEHGLQFLALNSAWEIDEHFPKRSAIHETALERCLKRAADDLAAGRVAPGAPVTRIAVWHHPITGNEKISADAFLERLRQSDIRLCLHGHVHEDRADLVAHTDPVRKLYAVGAGSFGAVAKHRPESTPRLYNVIEIDPAHRWFRVHTRARPRSGGAWGPWANWSSDRPGERRAFYEVSLPPPFSAGRSKSSPV